MRRRNYAAAARNLTRHAWRRSLQLVRSASWRALELARRIIPGLGPPSGAGFRHTWDCYPEVSSEARSLRRAYARLAEASRAAERGPPPAGAGKPRLALVSPFPPERTGIADYTGQLAPALAAHYDVTVITYREHGGRRPAGVEVRNSGWFEENAATFDRVLYHFGNSHYHAYMVPLLERFPGVVMLHDFGLGDFGAYLEHLRPGWWREALYDSHGLEALAALHRGEPWARLVARYPSSQFIFEQAEGVLMHSRFAQGLALRFYGERAAQRTGVVPFIRVPVDEVPRAQARARLGLGEDEFLVCTFGFVGRAKLTRRVVEAWLKSPLSARSDCRLVIVGQAGEDEYGRDLVRRLASRPEANIKLTGFADAETWADYLAAADAAVQLRADTRGENSGALFDCMAYGVATIVNAHGSLTETPPQAAVILPDRFTDDELASALLRLREDPETRRRLGQAARREIEVHHGPAPVAAAYAQAIEAFHRSAPTTRNFQKLMQAGRTASADAIAAARAMAAADQPGVGEPRLLVDVSAIAQADLHTGIQRVVRAQLLALLEVAPPGLRVEPVRVSWAEGKSRYLHARAYAWRILGLPAPALPDEPVEFRPGDRLYVPDLCADAMLGASRDGVFEALRALGVPVSVLIHDLLPFQLPDCFPPEADALHAQWLLTAAGEADQLICISRAVQEELEGWLARNAPARLGQLRLATLHHGADIDASAPTRGLPPNAGAVLDRLRADPTFLMVGTIEPRKGYAQALAAFHRLWEEGCEVNLVIVGAEGWKHDPPERRRAVAEIMAQLRGSPFLARRLFWLEGASDEYLGRVMKVSDCLLAASLGEGFGLPLIEAAQRGLPILARDIPVFREVAGEAACYFEGEAPEDLAGAIERWLRLHEVDEHPASDLITPLTWAENARRLLALLGADEPSGRRPRAESAPPESSRMRPRRKTA